jgi:hypothetical protein
MIDCHREERSDVAIQGNRTGRWSDTQHGNLA